MSRARICAAGRYGLILALVLILWLASGSGWILGLAVMLLLVPPVSLAANLYVRRRIFGRIVLPTSAAKGTGCMGSLELENRSWFPAPKLRCRIRMVNDLTREETGLELTAGLGPKDRTSQAFQMESPCCGRVYMQVVSAGLMDWLGLFSLAVPLKAEARITVLPELFACHVESTPLAACSDESAAARRGHDRTEVFSLREYQSGDDIRQIHWKLSSKLDHLILREPAQSVSRSLLVFWDKRHRAVPESMDAMAEVTASVCQALCHSGMAFDLCWTEGEELELRQIRDEETLLQSIPALVTRAGSPECPDPDLTDYGRVIAIRGQPAETEDEKTVCLLCAAEDHDDPGCISFTPRNYAEKLERLEL